MIPQGFEWNQAVLPSGRLPIKDGLVILFAFMNNRSPRLIGTGFIVNASKSSAVTITAAHNFEAIGIIQAGHRHHHPTALPEFIGDLTHIDLDRKKVRALCLNRHGPEALMVDWAVWDQKADIAFLGISTQDTDSAYFDTFFRLNKPTFKLNDQVALLGFSELEILKEERDGKGFEKFSYKQQLLLRKGFITDFHPNGHLLCKGPCLETSIPVFSGMSGGPAFLVPNEGEDIKPFGLISSDPESDNERKNDRSLRGNSIIALLNVEIESDENQEAIFKLNKAKVLMRDS